VPPDVQLTTETPQSVAFSPDGTQVAFVGWRSGDRNRNIFVRRLDQTEVTPLLHGNETATSCFFSPDGRALGFINTNNAVLNTVSLPDGLALALTGSLFYGGAAWGRDNRITFARADGLWQVPATGGAATPLTRVDKTRGEVSHQWPTVLPDGKVVLFTVVKGSSPGVTHIEALSVATGQPQVLIDPGTFPLYALSGHLIFFRDNALLAAAFDVKRNAIIGPPIRIADDIAVDVFGAPVMAVSHSGALIYRPAGLATSKMVWVTRHGLEQPVTDATRAYNYPRVAPDGHRSVVSVNGDLWIWDTARATFTPLTSDATAANTYPVWTPDGKRVVFRTRTGLRWIEADGSGPSQAIADTIPNDYPSSVSPDGRTLAFLRISEGTSGDVYVLSLSGEPQPRPIVQGPAYEGGPQFSPDGRWLAYASNESGVFQVYLRAFPGPEGRWPVSTEGGSQPRWSRNGKELFYRNGNKLMVVEVSTTPQPVLSTPRLLFEQPYTRSAITMPDYDVSPDGQRFLMLKPEAGYGRLNVVLNWQEELKQRVPTK
jgi:Tol biopolymer transport system component